MKKNLHVTFVFALIILPLNAMQGDELDNSLNPNIAEQTEWKDEVKFLVEHFTKAAKGEKENIILSYNQNVLDQALTLYKKANPCQKEERLNAPCIQALSNNMPDELTSSRITVAAFLQLVKEEHKEFFRQKMFEWAIIRKNVDVVEYLITQEKVNIYRPNLVGSTPLVLACECGDESIVEILLDHYTTSGPNFKAACQDFKFALEAAKRYNRDSIVASLEAKSPKSQKASSGFCLIS